MAATHTWKFFRAGGFDQVKLETGADLANLDQLDQKLWVALACPTRGLEFDNRTLDLIDADKDGRVRVPEVISAAKWATGLLKNPDDLIKGRPRLPLAAINDAAPEGKQILASAKQILANLGKTTPRRLTWKTRRIPRRFLPPQISTATASSPPMPPTMTRRRSSLPTSWPVSASRRIAAASRHRAGQGRHLFCRGAGAFRLVETGRRRQTILPLGEATAAASASVKAVKVKVDDFFARCRLAAFDARAIGALNRQESEYLALAAKDLTVTSAEIAGFPLAQIAAGKALPLVDGVNPAWAAALATFQSAAVKPLLAIKVPSLNPTGWR